MAAALTIYAAALVGANAAPSYRKHVGLAIAFADFAICVVALLAATILASNVEPLLPPNMLFLYLLIPTSGVAFTAFSLAGNKSLINKPLVTTKIPSAALGVRWFLGLSVALSSAAAFEAVSIGVSALWPTALPRVSANILATLIGTGITVTLVAEYAPVGKMVAAWVAAGAFMVISVASIVILAVHFVRHGFGYGLIQFWGTYYFVYFLATISGAVLGLRASAVRSNVSPSLP